MSSTTQNGRSAQAPQLAPVTVGTLEPNTGRLSEDDRQLICRTQMQPQKSSGPITVDELDLFCRQVESTGLNPFSRQIYVEFRNDNRNGGQRMTVITTIDGLRTIAERTGRYDGRTAPMWAADDGVWKEVFPEGRPTAAKVGVYKRGAANPTYGIAHMAEYDDGRSGGMYGKMPRNQLAVRAEAQALRAAFPAQLSGLYVTEELGEGETPAPVQEAPASAPVEEAPDPAPAPVPAPPAPGAEQPSDGGGMSAVAVEGTAASPQARQVLRKGLSEAELSGEAASQLARFLFDEGRSDRLSEDQMRELTEVVATVAAGGIAEGTLKGQLTKAEGAPDRSEAKALLMRWILKRANEAKPPEGEGLSDHETEAT